MSNKTKPEEMIALDKIIKKSRVHLYKPVQIAEILYQHRMHGVDLNDIESYRNVSKKWRDIISLKLVGRISTSSAKYQDNVFEENALPPRLIAKLGEINKAGKGEIEKYIYFKFEERHSDLSAGLAYCNAKNLSDFCLNEFVNHFTAKPGLKRSMDKVYEIIVYALFSSLVDAFGISVKVEIADSSSPLFAEFGDFAQKILQVTKGNRSSLMPAKIFRAGVTNAADRGLDMWANFGLAIQIKHLSLTEDLAKGVVGEIPADRIIVVCKDAEEKLILSLLNQIGWKSRIQAIVVWSDLESWYEKPCGENLRHKLAKLCCPI